MVFAMIFSLLLATLCDKAPLTMLVPVLRGLLPLSSWCRNVCGRYSEWLVNKQTIAGPQWENVWYFPAGLAAIVLVVFPDL